MRSAFEYSGKRMAPSGRVTFSHVAASETRSARHLAALLLGARQPLPRRRQWHALPLRPRTKNGALGQLDCSRQVGATRSLPFVAGRCTCARRLRCVTAIYMHSGAGKRRRSVVREQPAAEASPCSARASVHRRCGPRLVCLRALLGGGEGGGWHWGACEYITLRCFGMQLRWSDGQRRARAAHV